MLCNDFKGKKNTFYRLMSLSNCLNPFAIANHFPKAQFPTEAFYENYEQIIL